MQPQNNFFCITASCNTDPVRCIVICQLSDSLVFVDDSMILYEILKTILVYLTNYNV